MTRIAVVDDEQKLCEILKKVLESFGYEVSVYLSPVTFLEQFKSHSYSCLLLDLNLGTLSGLDYLEKILE